MYKFFLIVILFFNILNYSLADDFEGVLTPELCIDVNNSIFYREQVGATLEKDVKKKERDVNTQKELEKLEQEGFIRNFSGVVHDLRNPLTLILLHSKSIREIVDGLRAKASLSADIDASLGKIVKLVGKIDLHGKKTSTLVQETLNYVKSQKAVEIEEVYLRDLIVRSFLDNKDLWDNPDYPVEVDIACEKGLENIVIAAEPNALMRVFLNLITNACHAMQGKVERILNVSIQLHPDKSNMVQLVFQNNGEEMGEQAIEYFNDVKQKVEKGETVEFSSLFTTKKQGSGLGTLNMHTIVVKHNGELNIDMSVTQGACFTLSLPYTNTQLNVAPRYEFNDIGKLLEVSSESYPIRSILFVDDESVFCFTAKHMIEKYNVNLQANKKIEYSQALGFSQALELLTEIKEGRRVLKNTLPELIISDMQMENRNSGIHLAYVLRLLGYKGHFVISSADVDETGEDEKFRQERDDAIITTVIPKSGFVNLVKLGSLLIFFETQKPKQPKNKVLFEQLTILKQEYPDIIESCRIDEIREENVDDLREQREKEVMSVDSVEKQIADSYEATQSELRAILTHFLLNVLSRNQLVSDVLKDNVEISKKLLETINNLNREIIRILDLFRESKGGIVLEKTREQFSQLKSLFGKIDLNSCDLAYQGLVRGRIDENSSMISFFGQQHSLLLDFCHKPSFVDFSTLLSQVKSIYESVDEFFPKGEITCSKVFVSVDYLNTPMRVPFSVFYVILYDIFTVLSKSNSNTFYAVLTTEKKKHIRIELDVVDGQCVVSFTTSHLIFKPDICRALYTKDNPFYRILRLLPLPVLKGKLSIKDDKTLILSFSVSPMQGLSQKMRLSDLLLLQV